MSALATTERRDDDIHIKVTGEIDRDTTATLDHAVTAAISTDPPPAGLVVDLTGVSFLGCAGVTTLLRGRDLAARHRITYRAAGAHGIALYVLQTLKLDTLLSDASPPSER